MDKELSTWYENQFDLMAHQGWLDLMEKFSELKVATSDISTVQDAQQLHFRKGQLDIITWLLNWKSTCEKVYEDIQNG
jgi:hypothetical protein